MDAETMTPELLRRFTEVQPKIAPALHLLDNPDGLAWAREFIQTVTAKPSLATDEGTMHSWFANAIMCGWDRAVGHMDQRAQTTVSADALRAAYEQVRGPDKGEPRPEVPPSNTD